MSFSFSLSLPVRNEWKNVALVRSSVQNCFVAAFDVVDQCQTVAMVTGELVENAIKYGDWSGEDRSFRLDVDAAGGKVTVSVRCPVSKEREEVDRLLGLIAWIDTFAAPEDAYRARLLELASEPREAQLSRLGLVRIAYEANAKLVADVDKGTLRVTAEMMF